MSGQQRIRVKICGMTRLKDARCAVEAGVDALGFIFYEKSPRAIDPDEARRIIEHLPPFVGAVGVFVNMELHETAAIIRHCRLGYAQLHGSESPEYCRDLACNTAPCRLLKAFRVGSHSTAAEIAPYNDCVQGFLLDTFQKSAVGGTGESFDWSIIDRLHLARPLLLAGGLGVDNIRTALESVRPYGVDANSGLETAPGVKDHSHIRRFITSVRAFEADCLTGQQ
jgi:phosphoribosylanthranilate isomerase